MEFWDAERDVLDGVPLFPFVDLGHIFADCASGMGVKRGEGVPVLCLEAIQDGLEDSFGVIGEDSIRDVHCVDDVASCVLQDAADALQGLVRCAVYSLPFAFLGCGCHALCLPFLELVAGGEERFEVGVSFLSI